MSQYTEDRKQMVSLLLMNLDGKLLSYIKHYNNENIKYKCNKCDKEKEIDFALFYKKVSHQQFCNCHKSEVIENLEMFSLEFFDQQMRELNEEKVENNNKRKEFLRQEENQLMYLIAKNRGCKYYIRSGSKFEVVCKDEHKNLWTIDEVVKGHWCEECFNNEKHYFLEEHNEEE